jgi:hypothetical protein
MIDLKIYEGIHGTKVYYAVTWKQPNADSTADGVWFAKYVAHLTPLLRAADGLESDERNTHSGTDSSSSPARAADDL